MKKITAAIALAVATTLPACNSDVTTSDEYQALEQELAVAQAGLDDVEQSGSSERHDRALVVMNEIMELLEDPEAFGTEDEVADLLGAHATDTAVMDDDVFGAVGYRQAFFNTLYGGTTDAHIEVYDSWISADGAQGGFLWMWSGTNAAGHPFELAGISLIEFAEDGRISYELVTYPYPDDYVREAFLGDGTPTGSTG